MLATHYDARSEIYTAHCTLHTGTRPNLLLRQSQAVRNSLQPSTRALLPKQNAEVKEGNVNLLEKKEMTFLGVPKTGTLGELSFCLLVAAIHQQQHQSSDIISY